MSSHLENFHSLYNLGIMHMYGIGVALSCPSAVQYLRSATEVMVWKKYFANVYDLYLGGQRKVAAMMYMILGEVGSQIAQLNAGNILDGNAVFTGKFWIHSIEPGTDMNKRLAFKYYSGAFAQGSDAVDMRLGDFYYHGYDVEPDLDVAVAYYERASYRSGTATQLSYAWFTNGMILHYGTGKNKNFGGAMEAYNYSAMFHPTSYYPVAIMMKLLDFDTQGRKALLPPLEKATLGVAVGFCVVVIWFICKRRV